MSLTVQLEESHVTSHEILKYFRRKYILRTSESPLWTTGLFFFAWADLSSWFVLQKLLINTTVQLSLVDFYHYKYSYLFLSRTTNNFYIEWILLDNCWNILKYLRIYIYRRWVAA